METKELIETYKEGLRGLVDHLDSYRKSKLTKGSKLGEYIRILSSASSRKYVKTTYPELLEVMHKVDETVGKVYTGYEYPSMHVFPDDPERTVKVEADRLSRIMVALGVRGIFHMFDAERVRRDYRKLTSVTDPQAVFLKNLSNVADVLNEPVGDPAFRAMATDLFVAIRDVQGSAFKKSDNPYYTNMVLSYNEGGGLASALVYKHKVEKYQEMVHEMLRHAGVTPKTGREFSMDLREYNLWLEDELANLEELYLCVAYYRILNVL